jgi:hypothetical protein
MTMFNPTRRSLLRSLLTVPTVLVGSGLVAIPEIGCGSNCGTLNFHLEGPFAFVCFKSRNEMYVLGPNAPYHHLPAATWATGEAEIKKSEYALIGPKPHKGVPGYEYPDRLLQVDRLQVDGKALGLDAPNKKIDVDRRRFFSLLVPTPARIIPWHPVLVNISGDHSPFPPDKSVRLPVGYTLTYENVDFGDVHIKCLADPKMSLRLDSNAGDDNLHLRPFPGQKHVDILVQMESSEDQDADHWFAQETFGACCGMFTHLDLLAPKDLRRTNDAKDKKHWLDLAVKYLPPEHGHTGSDCKAPVVEIVGVDDSTSLGSGTYGG